MRTPEWIAAVAAFVLAAAAIARRHRAARSGEVCSAAFVENADGPMFRYDLRGAGHRRSR